MLRSLRALLAHWFGTAPHADHSPPTPPPSLSSDSANRAALDANNATSHFVPYDENLLERARTQWQFGDWENLACIELDTLQHHPDRAKLALLAATGRMQTNQIGEGRRLLQLALDWGMNRKLVEIGRAHV